MDEEPAVLLSKAEPSRDKAPAVLFPRERRRPGRSDHRNPHLIALLRQPAAGSGPPASCVIPDVILTDGLAGRPALHENGADHRSAAPGIGLGLLVAAPVWAAIVALGWWLIDG